ncbi:hypothetical protein SBA4_2790019 [Candidatus Sulfopaludibacter sp. SbA4]|nr:hypothetical protein SBA4_2790019 [Candidatus Sulfopaludibacter sp. SbA4]
MEEDMPSVERTAYPRFSRSLTAQELSRFFTLAYPFIESSCCQSLALSRTVRVLPGRRRQRAPGRRH